MSGEAKTVSELCREALELRELAPGQFESIKGRNRLLLDNDPRYFGWNMGEEYADFIAFAANHIKQIAESYLSTCKELGLNIKSYNELKAENQKLREALKLNHEHHIEYDERGDYSGSDLWSINMEALKRGQGG